MNVPTSTLPPPPVGASVNAKATSPTASEPMLSPSSSATQPSPPPSYASTDAQGLSTGFEKLNLTPSTLSAPTPDQCIAHLKLLEAFHKLREGISRIDGLFDIHDGFASKSGTQTQQEQEIARAQILEKRWAVYVHRAVDRFERWWSWSKTFNISPPNRLVISQLEYKSGFENIVSSGTRRQVGPEALPPLGQSQPLPSISGS